jgi:hypothetical protein
MAAAALAVAILALFVSGWAAWTAHRAFTLERDRRHDELAPRIEVEEGDHDNPIAEGIRIINRGPVDLDSIRFSIISDADRYGPVDALHVGGDWHPAGDLGPFTIGHSRFVALRYSREAPNTMTLRLLLICTSGKDRWEFPVEVTITPPPTPPMAAWR